MGNRGSAAVETRTIEIGKYDGKTFPDNRVISYKYTAWNFLIKNLFEQFRRVANFYFLCMGIIAAVIPDSPVTSWATLFPLLFVVTVSAIKQGYEDYRRHKADNKINNSLVTVVRDGVAQEIRCKKVCVGDIVKVGADMDIPCDLVMLISSHPDSKGYITTANLDGETNLKTVECPIDTDLNVDHLPHLKGTITCEPPTVDLYGFHGNISLSLTQGEGDMEAFNPVFVKDGYAMDTLHGDSCKGRHRVSFSKIHFLAQREYTAPLNATNLLLRGSRLRNTEFVFGCAVYTGKETKLALNSTLTINKFSTIEKSVNRFLLFFVILLMVEVLSSVFLTFCFERRFGTPDKWYLGPMERVTVKDVLNDIFVYFVLYYYIIPISLYVTIELQRFLGTFFFEWDLDMFCNEQSAICNTSDLNEELGQVQYLFSDKTGTLTENDMKFRRCSIEGSMFVETKGELMLLPPSGVLPTQLPISYWPPEVEQFLLAMALCHCVQTRGEMSGQGIPHDTRKVPEYQASSPDEKALVLAASRCGVVFLGTEGGYASVSVRGQIKKFKKLQTLEFSSDRKRMSVVVSDSDDQVWLFCKGAESSMMPLMVSGHREETIRHYTDFSLRGLRTLVLGLRKMDTGEYLRLARALRVARSTIDVTAREARLSEVFNDFETALHLQGATAVEDRLQERVPETLELLRSAGIKVWVLTGDKVETALNIAYSCGHFKQGTRRLDLYDLTSETECLNTLQEFRCQMEEESLAQYGLVVDGTAVRLALLHDQGLLCQIACNCTTVLCCRLSPKQKAEKTKEYRQWGFKS
ncbi:putative phospholipid-transporting ATPase IF [Homalodisca vitripennis]|nr:putative phospholipid-transporting ATPase IF [Homalodisca vitripennis]